MAKITLIALLIAVIAATSVQGEGWVEMPKPLYPGFIDLVIKAAEKVDRTVGEIRDGYYDERVNTVLFKAFGTLNEESGSCNIYFTMDYVTDIPIDISYECGLE